MAPSLLPYPCGQKDRCAGPVKLKLTRASPAEKEAVLNLGKHFPGDYLEHVIDRWINQASGGLYLAWHDGSPVGCCALSFASPTEGWLQGMRVHPGYRGRGIAFHLSGYLMDLAKSRGAAVVRLLTAPHNHRAVQVSARLGFTSTGARREIFYMETLRRRNVDFPEQSSLPQPCSESELAEAAGFLSTGGALESSSGLMFCPGYMYRTLTAAYLSQAVKKKEVYLLDNKGLRRGLVVAVKDKSERHLVIGYLDAPHEALPSVCAMLPGWYGEGYRRFSLGLLREQHRVLQPRLEQLFGPYESEQWMVMERKLTADGAAGIPRSP